jgi:chromosome segregation protein
VRVRRLQLQGFKTFAIKTTFQFEEGITAIVGPNGSGKSNLADALRWVLGEQSYSTLRSRRTEELIFSGSSARPRMGMTEVSLLLDNEDQYLPVDFGEVEIVRRAHRSGANEYFLNRRRVRLQDIREILGGITSSYVVIHQGLIDEALTLRPKERRILLEEAAEVHRYHERRQRAQERLRRTESNITRVSDLRNELSPRLRSLERQSQQARRRARVEDRLHQTLCAWYRRLWEEASTSLDEARNTEQKKLSRLERARSSYDEAASEANRLRQTMNQAQRLQAEQRQKEDELRRRQESAQRALAQAEGEQQALQRYRQELSAEIERWRQEVAEQEERLQQVEQARVDLETRIEEAQRNLELRETAHRQAEQALREIQEKREISQQPVMENTTGILHVERHLESQASRLEALERELTERDNLIESVGEQLRRAEQEKQEGESALLDLSDRVADLLAREQAAREQATQARDDVQQARESLEQARWRLAEDRARLEAMGQVGAEDDGASFLSSWAEQRGRPAFPTLFSRLEIAPELQNAVEAGLGAASTALLAQTWDEAQDALDALADAVGGRATLLPLEELRPPAADPPQSEDSEGLLSDLLTCSEEDRPAVDSLLGFTLLAPSLESARRLARTLHPGWTVVTREGHALTAEGVISGGQYSGEQSALRRETERQGLITGVSEAEKARRKMELACTSAQQELDNREQALTELGRQRQETHLTREEQARRVEELTCTIVRLDKERAQYQERLQAISEEKQSLAVEQASNQDRLQSLQAAQESLQQDVEQLRALERSSQQEYAQARDQMQEARTLWAVVSKEQENQQVLAGIQQRNARRLQQQIEEGEQRLQEGLLQLASWEERAGALRAELKEADSALEPLTDVVWATPISLDELARWDDEAATRRHQVLELEGAATRATGEVQRQEDRLREVLRRGVAEVGPEASAYGSAGEALLNAMMENPPEWAHEPLDPRTPEELERRIARLREQIHRIGPVNPLAEEEYRQTNERYEFLGHQLEDLQDAVRSTRRIIAELDRAMEERFRETFDAINIEFQAYFSRLFNGGTARLELVRTEQESDGLASLGVDISARPPGKRAHSLALLSGGERALASAALLFAILKVNPRPFCLLDEVDAMLDEANVGRFRECLEELAAQTQFILITHNRGTIEAAHTLYGVSLAEDGTSRVLSLRLEEALQ